VVKGEADWRERGSRLGGRPGSGCAGWAARRPAAPPNQLGACLEKLLAEAASSYDLILIDAPPLLGFAERCKCGGGGRGGGSHSAGQTNRKALASVLTSLKRLKANVNRRGANEVREDMSDRYYYYGYYGKYYSKYYKPTKT